MVGYQLGDGIARITMDDGKVNALSPAMLAELHTAFDRAELDDAVVLLCGRDRVFSAGFDLAVLRTGGAGSAALVRTGFELALRMLSFPRPVIVACTGHAVAMGAFLLLSGDYRVGGSGPYKLVANEVAIGLSMPHAACEILRQRLTPACFHRAVALAETFHPGNAVEAGFLDQVVDQGRVIEVAQQAAESTLALDRDAHASTKLRARRLTLDTLRAGIDADSAAMAALA